MSDNQNTDDTSVSTDTSNTDDSASTNTDDSASGDETVTLSKKDHSELVSQRDRANEEIRKLKESGNSENDLMYEIAKERGIDQFLKENKEKYPDVTADDLKFLDDPEQLEAAASHLQSTINDRVQKKLSDVQVADERPQLSEEDRKKKLAALEKSDSPDKFEQMVNLQSQ